MFGPKGVSLASLDNAVKFEAKQRTTAFDEVVSRIAAQSTVIYTSKENIAELRGEMMTLRSEVEGIKAGYDAILARLDAIEGREGEPTDSDETVEEVLAYVSNSSLAPTEEPVEQAGDLSEPVDEPAPALQEEATPVV